MGGWGAESVHSILNDARVSGPERTKKPYRVVQLNATPETEVFDMLFDRSLSIFSMTFLKQHMEYFNFRCKIQFDLYNL